MKFELYQGKDKGTKCYRWRALETILSRGRSEEAFEKKYISKAVDAVKRAAEKKKIQLYVDKKGEYRWRLLAANNEVVAISTSGEPTKAIAKKWALLFCTQAIHAKKVWAKVDKKKKTK